MTNHSINTNQYTSSPSRVPDRLARIPSVDQSLIGMFRESAVSEVLLEGVLAGKEHSLASNLLAEQLRTKPPTAPYINMDHDVLLKLIASIHSPQ